jgi:uncharacterized Fe-S cluster-containing radical SAM superfamily protein
MPDTGPARRSQLDPAKFRDPDVTAGGEVRASVPLGRLRTLWFNTGSPCNIACDNCYIESSPRNDRLAWLGLDEVRGYLDEIDRQGGGTEEIGFTGGEPFMNRDLPSMLADALGRGYRVLVLTNAMTPMWHRRAPLARLKQVYDFALALRVSIDHYRPERHERVRGAGTWAPMLRGLRWLAAGGFAVSVASRKLWDEDEADLRRGFAGLFSAEGIVVDAFDPDALVLFPEMDAGRDVPEITVRCWSLLGVSPDAMMCASSRMVLKRRGAERPVVVPCTLLPYDRRFELGARLADAAGPVKLNHPFCAQFCVLGGASCSRAEE